MFVARLKTSGPFVCLIFTGMALFSKPNIYEEDDSGDSLILDLGFRDTKKKVNSLHPSNFEAWKMHNSLCVTVFSLGVTSLLPCSLQLL